MTITHAAIKLEPGAGGGRIQRGNQLVGFRAGNIAGGIVEHFAVFHGDEVGAVGHVGGLQRQARAGGFDGCAAGIIF